MSNPLSTQIFLEYRTKEVFDVVTSTKNKLSEIEQYLSHQQNAELLKALSHLAEAKKHIDDEYAVFLENKRKQENAEGNFLQKTFSVNQNISAEDIKSALLEVTGSKKWTVEQFPFFQLLNSWQTIRDGFWHFNLDTTNMKAYSCYIGNALNDKVHLHFIVCTSGDHFVLSQLITPEMLEKDYFNKFINPMERKFFLEYSIKRLLDRYPA